MVRPLPVIAVFTFNFATLPFRELLLQISLLTVNDHSIRQRNTDRR